MKNQAKALSQSIEESAILASLEAEALQAKTTQDKFQANPTFRSARELIETLAIALFLSILFKFFEAEAYVIPTGSMAPTLMGRHKDVHCKECGFAFQVSASEERNRENQPTTLRVTGGVCPQCHLTQNFEEGDLSYSGDRVLVNKFIGDFVPVRRWDVTVFRSPPDPKTNYIKRVVGLPNENIRVQYGDLFIQKIAADGSLGEFEIARKPLKNLLRMLRTVDDIDYQPIDLLNLGWPSRWNDDQALSGSGIANWQMAEDGKSFHYDGHSVKVEKTFSPYRVELNQSVEMESDSDSGETGFQWLRYRHIVPSSRDWQSFAQEKLPADLQVSGQLHNNPQLITDLTAYNTSENSGRSTRAGYGFNWTGDLALSFEMTPNEKSEEILLELIKGGVAFHARLNFLRGEISLEIPEVGVYQPETVPYAFCAGRKYQILFINIDEQLRVVINNKEIEFPNGGSYDHLCHPLPNGEPGVLARNRDPNEKDLTPAAIGAKGEMALAHLKILRDTYYIADGNHLETAKIPDSEGGEKKLFQFGPRDSIDHYFADPVNVSDENAFTRFLSTPALWQDYGNTRSAFFEIGVDQYLALGDNSSNSEDGRSWGWGRRDQIWPDGQVPCYVDRELILGKAVCVYWPHGGKIPGTRLPFVPNFGKMRKIN